MRGFGMESGKYLLLTEPFSIHFSIVRLYLVLMITHYSFSSGGSEFSSYSG